MLGFGADELTDQTFYVFCPPEDHEATLHAVQHLPDDGMLENFENRYRTKSGTYRWLRWSARINREDRRVYAVARDITERKRSETALAESEARYRVVAESASDAIITIDEKSTITYVNGAVTRIFGYEREALLAARSRC